MHFDTKTKARLPTVLTLEKRRPVTPVEPAGPAEHASPRRRMLWAGPIVAVVSTAAALIATDAAGLPLRDPDHVAGRRLLLVFGLVGLLVMLDVAVRAGRRAGTWRPSRAELLAVRRERWTRGRGTAVALALLSFYVSYLAYRNLKSVVPVLRPGDLFDRQLADVDRALFGGNDPATLMQTFFGTELMAHAMSASYMIFFAFIPGTLAFALVFSPNLQAGLFYATAQSLNWLLGAASYFVLPALGPIYADPGQFGSLPSTGVGRLQDLLLDQRVDFLRDPVAGSAQSIAAFASLHVSIFFTGAVAAQLLGYSRRVVITAWVMFALTVASTIFLGWHYVVDDLAGVVLGAMALGLAWMLTGLDLRDTRRAPTRGSRPS